MDSWPSFVSVFYFGRLLISNFEGRASGWAGEDRAGQRPLPSAAAWTTFLVGFVLLLLRFEKKEASFISDRSQT
jgi:hypothetical protein